MWCSFLLAFVCCQFVQCIVNCWVFFFPKPPRSPGWHWSLFPQLLARQLQMLQNHLYRASSLCGMPLYTLAFAGTHPVKMSWVGWLNTKTLRYDSNPQTITHSSINWAQHRATMSTICGVQVWCHMSRSWFSWPMVMCFLWGHGRAGAWTSSMARTRTSAMVHGLTGSGEWSFITHSCAMSDRLCIVLNLTVLFALLDSWLCINLLLLFSSYSVTRCSCRLEYVTVV